MSTYLFVADLEVAPDGTMTVSRRAVGTISNSISYAGGNETPGILSVDTASNTYWMFDTEHANNWGVGGIPLVGSGTRYNNVCPFTTGTGYLVLHFADSLCQLRRYTVGTTGGTASTASAMMTIPSGYEPIKPGMVFDEGAYIGVFARRAQSSPDGFAIDLLVYDGTGADPLWTVVLWDGTGNAVWDPDDDLPCAFARVDGTYQVLYPRPPLTDLGDPAVADWTSYVRASLDMTDGTLGDPVLVSDTKNESTISRAFVRADGGVTMLEVDNRRIPADTGTETPSKLVLGVLEPDDTTAGDALFADWVGDYASPNDYLLTHLFVGTGVAATGSTPPGTGDSPLPSNTVAPARFSDLSFELRASLSLSVASVAPYTATELALTSRAHIEPYYVVRGQPVRHAQFGVDAVAEVGAGTVGETLGWPVPGDVVLGSDFRWLPVEGSLVNQWTDTIASEQLYLDGSPPAELDLAGSYLRGDELVSGGLVSISSYDGGGGFSTDPYDVTGLTLFLVAVLRPPEFDYYALMGTADDTYSPSSTLPYLEVRYYPDGRVVTYSRSQLASFQTTTGVARAGQPIIVGLSLDTTTGLVTTVACDRNPAFAQSRLVGDHPTPLVALLGDVPDSFVAFDDLGNFIGGQGVASMDVLDFSLWQRALNTEEMAAIVHTLDGIYGVTQT